MFPGLELFEFGVTGFVVADVTAAAGAVERVAELDRQVVRAEAIRRFDSSRMVDEYVTAYARAMAESATRR